MLRHSVGDKGYHSREGLKDLESGKRGSPSEPANGYLRWHGDEAARQLKSGVGMRKRSEMVERSFAHVLDRGGMRRAWLRGRENVHKRYLIHVAGFNLGILITVRIRHAEGGCERKERHFVRYSVRCCPGDAIVANIEGKPAILVSHPKRIDQKAGLLRRRICDQLMPVASNVATQQRNPHDRGDRVPTPTSVWR